MMPFAPAWERPEAGPPGCRGLVETTALELSSLLYNLSLLMASLEKEGTAILNIKGAYCCFVGCLDD